MQPKNQNNSSEQTNTPNNSKAQIRPMFGAGNFYPADKEELTAMLAGFFSNKPSQNTNPKIIIAPHAGYIFSGSTASKAFASLQKNSIKKVILLGNSHQDFFQGLKLDNTTYWQTPLGKIKTDQNNINKLAKQSQLIQIDNSIHLQEHSLEVILPFLQYKLGNQFQIIPGLFGSQKNLQNLQEISQILIQIFDEQTLLVISSDLSHYPSQKDAQIIDEQTINSILSNNLESFFTSLEIAERGEVDNLSTCACGWPAIATAMLIAKQNQLQPQLIEYTNSAQNKTYGNPSQVVGYVAINFYPSSNKNNLKLDPEEQKAALKLARTALEKHFKPSVGLDESYKNFNIFNQNLGVFVTLKKQGELRGCIGLIEPPEFSLATAIQQMSLAAAFEDHRFSPLSYEELQQVNIEISILTPPKKISSSEEIELGKHGVIIKRGVNSGVFLPQVATETGWNKKTFLEQLCTQKAELESNCYQKTNTNIYTFTAQIFHE